jgi:hypothetical protein
MDQALFVGLLRHALQLAGGALMARGYVDSGAMELISGGVVSLFTAGWYLVGKRK